MKSEDTQLRKLHLNVRASQSDFLKFLCAEADVEISEIFRQLIDVAELPDSEQGSTPLDGLAIQYTSRSAISNSRAKSWKRITIYLDAAHFGLLQAQADQAKTSKSSTLRHLLKNYMTRFNVASSARPPRFIEQFRRKLVRGKTKGSLALIAVLVGIILTVVLSLNGDNSIEIGPHWAGNEATVILDPHTHTRYSDGELSAPELVDMAVKSGCDALVITDHSDSGGAVSDLQMKELEDLRSKYADFMLFHGIELNMPSYGGREHAGLIADPTVEADTLQEIRDVAQRNLKRAKNGGASSTADMDLLQVIADYQSFHRGLLLIYNHPSRKDAELAENLSDLKKWNAWAPVFTAIEGGPGHQKAPVIGSYEEPHLTEDHWDPVVAEVGGVWDELLSEGHRIWGALASSDYHNERLDKAPCAFARTHLITPEHSYRGSLRALKAGTFWADHGRILDQLWFGVEVDGLKRAVYPGSIVNIRASNTMAVASLSIKRGPGSVGQPLTAEIIGNCISGKAEILAELAIAPAESMVTTELPLLTTGLDGVSCSVRARVRLSRPSSTDYLAYTNPIRFILN